MQQNNQKETINQNEEQKDETKKVNQKQNKVQKNKFWKLFWITVISLIIVFAVLNIIAFNNFKPVEKKKTPIITEKILTELQQKAPQLFTLLQNLPKEYKLKIKESINKNIDEAFNPLYSHIDDFADFHYSVTGQYAELFALLKKETQKFLIEKVFKPANFDENLNKALQNINSDVKNILKEYYSKIEKDIQNQLNISNKQTDFILSKIFQLSENDMANRLNNNIYNTLKGIGFGGGGVASAIVIKKMMAKKISTAVTEKIMTKLAIKAGSKIATTTAGAAVGAESGLLCGPGAILCPGIGGIIGGIIGYFASDKIVVEIDKFLNEDQFKQKIKKLIDTQKERTKLILYNVYLQSFKKLNLENTKMLKEKIEELKHKKIEEIITQ